MDKKEPNWDIEPDEVAHFGVIQSNGRQVEIKVNKWDDKLIRSKREYNMKDKPFDLISIQAIDPLIQEPIYKNRLWLAVWGECRTELSVEQAYWSYR